MSEGMTKFKLPNGVIKEVPDSEGADMVRLGGQVVNEYEEQKRADQETLLGKGQSLFNGMAAGASFGLIPKVATELGLQSHSELEDSEKYNPGIYKTGEVAGMVMPTSAGPLGTVGHAIEHAVAGHGAGMFARIAGKTLAGAAEGGMLGLGGAVNESAIQDKPLTVEALVHHSLNGAMSGGILGGGLGVIGEGAGVLVKKLGDEGLQGLAEKASDKLAGSVLDKEAKANDWKMATDEQVQNIGETVNKYGLNKTGGTIKDISERVKPALDDVGKGIGDVLEQAGGKDVKFDMQPVIDKLRAEADSLGGGISKKSSGLKSELESQIELLENSKDASLKDIHGMMKDVTSFDKLAPNATIESGQKTYFALRDQLKDQLGTMGGDVSKFEQLSSDYSKLKSIQKYADHGAGKVGGILPSWGDMVGSAAATGGHPLLAIPGAIGKKLIRERGSLLASKALGALSKGGGMDVIADSLKGHVDGLLEGAGGAAALGEFGNVLQDASDKGAHALLEKHTELVAEHGVDYLKKLGLPIGDTATNVAAKADQIAHIRTAQADMSSQLDTGIKRFLGQQGGTTPISSGIGDKTSYNKKMENLRELVQNPAKLQDQLENVYLNQAPETSLALQLKTNQALEFLKSKLPMNPNENVIPALADKWQPNHAQVEKFSRYAEVVNDPTKAVQDLARGIVHPETVEALKAIYPKTLEDIQQKTMERLASYKGQLSRPKRDALATLFGQQIGSSGDKQKQDLIQQMHQSTMQGGKKTPQPGPTAAPGSTSYATSTERLMNKGPI